MYKIKPFTGTWDSFVYIDSWLETMQTVDGFRVIAMSANDRGTNIIYEVVPGSTLDKKLDMVRELLSESDDKESDFLDDLWRPMKMTLE